MLSGRDLGERSWSFDPWLAEVVWDQGPVGVLAVGAVGCAGATSVLGPPEEREVTSGTSGQQASK